MVNWNVMLLLASDWLDETAYSVELVGEIDRIYTTSFGFRFLRAAFVITAPQIQIGWHNETIIR